MSTRITRVNGSRSVWDGGHCAHYASAGGQAVIICANCYADRARAIREAEGAERRQGERR